jgi:solute carrier family 25 phosphate transporter 23/24/25/41
MKVHYQLFLALAASLYPATATATDGEFYSSFLEFRIFVRQAENQLFDLFKSIDRDGNGKLDKSELQTAFKAAGLTVSKRRLNDFFGDMDLNNDGYVSFDEWR